MFDEEEKDKEDGVVSEDALEDVIDEDLDEEEKVPEVEEDDFRERDWA